MEEKKTLKEGEIICPKCGGKGGLDVPGEPDLRKTCDRCFGDGILDWLEVILGKAKRKLTARWTVDVSKEVQAFFNKDLDKTIMDALASELASDIDKKILEDLLKGSNKMKNTSFSIHKEK